MIEEFKLIGYSDVNIFNEELKECIIEYQCKGLTVDIKYSVTNSYFSALVIGRNESKCN